MPPRPLLLLTLTCATLALAGCSEVEQDPVGDSAASAEQAGGEAATSRASEQRTKKPRRRSRNKTGTAAYMLARIPTRNETSRAPYRRDYFGEWTRVGGCTTRQRVLQRQSTSGTSSGCGVEHGRWLSTYDGVRTRDPRRLDIDHLVPLSEAWRSGASRWSAGTRLRYANDLGYAATLRAVTATSNRSKSDQDPADWLPPRRIHHCKYIGSWIAVKYRWRLAADSNERAVLRRYVRECGRKSDVKRPRRAVVRISKRPIGTPQKASRSGAPEGGGATRSDRRYATCAEAKRHGLGPYRRGSDREYDWYRDADSDGIVCE